MEGALKKELKALKSKSGAFQIVVLDESKPCLHKNLKGEHRSMRQFEMHPRYTGYQQFSDTTEII
jgi:hypothetical protein